MSEDNLKIADTIFAYVKGTITEKQLEELTNWVKMSEEHKQLFQKMTTSASFRDKQKIYRRFNRFYDFNLIERKIGKKRKINLWRYVALTAAVILPLSIGLGWLLHSDQNEAIPGKNALIPGELKATLILSDGTTKNLNHESFEVIEGTRLVVNGETGLVYVPKESETAEEEIFNEIKVPRGGEYQVTLADGTQVWLNSESSIRFPVRFKNKQRKVWISGEVFFDVAKDSLHPFIVNSKNMHIQVLGTAFNVRDYGDEEQVAATLVEGRVELAVGTGKKIILQPSEQCMYNRITGVYNVLKVDPELFVSWKDGVYLFESQRLEDIMTLISRWYDLSVFYQGQSVRNVLFSGRLKRYENAEMLLEVFERLGGVRFTVQGKTVIVAEE